MSSLNQKTIYFNKTKLRYRFVFFMACFIVSAKDVFTIYVIEDMKSLTAYMLYVYLVEQGVFVAFEDLSTTGAFVLLLSVLVSLALAIFSFVYCLSRAKVLFSNTPALILNRKGIVNHIPLSFSEMLPWSEVIAVKQVASADYVYLLLKKRTFRLNPFKQLRLSLPGNKHNVESELLTYKQEPRTWTKLQLIFNQIFKREPAIIINASRLDIDCKELFELLNDYHHQASKKP